MTMDERGKRWMAYMDGQMSASESLEFERSLSPEDKKRMAEEVRLESEICDRLAGQECCPKALWNSLALKMTNQEPQQRDHITGWQRWVVAAASIATVITTSFVVYQDMSAEPAELSGLEISEDTLTEFASQIEVPGTREATQRFLDDHNLQLRMVGLDSPELKTHHPIKLVGACMGNCPKGELIEVRLTCCGKPIKLFIAKEGTGGARMIEKAIKCGTVQASRVSDGVVTALVGDIHGNVDLLNLLQPRAGNIV